MFKKQKAYDEINSSEFNNQCKKLSPHSDSVVESAISNGFLQETLMAGHSVGLRVNHWQRSLTHPVMRANKMDHRV